MRPGLDRFRLHVDGYCQVGTAIIGDGRREGIARKRQQLIDVRYHFRQCQPRHAEDARLVDVLKVGMPCLAKAFHPREAQQRHAILVGIDDS